MGKLWTYTEVAEFLGCSVNQVKNLVLSGEIPHKRIGRRKLVRFVPERLLEWANDDSPTFRGNKPENAHVTAAARPDASKGEGRDH